MGTKNQSIRELIAAENSIYRCARRAHVAAIIRGKMLEKGLRNVDIAERIGTSEPNVSRWLRGTQNLSIDTLYLLADAIEERLSIIFGNNQPVVAQDDDFNCYAEAPEGRAEQARPFDGYKNVMELSKFRMKKQMAGFEGSQDACHELSAENGTPSENGYEFA